MVTDMVSFRIGAAQVLVTDWPIFVIATIVFLVVLGLIVFALWKLKAFDKCRIYKDKLEEQQGIEERNNQTPIVKS